jgi:hypothetical protein
LVYSGGALERTILEYLWPFGIFYAHLLVLSSFGTFSSVFGTLHQEKSDIPAANGRIQKEIKAINIF